MTDERSESPVPSGKVKQVIVYRVAVKTLAKIILYWYQHGDVTPSQCDELREIARGKA